MANRLNKFPSGANALAAGIKALNRNPSTASGTGYYVTDSLSIDFRIQGFINDNLGPTNVNVGANQIEGTKFIINSVLLPSNVTTYYDDSETGFAELAVNDVIVWNSSAIRTDDLLGAWELWYDASSTGISGASGGAFGYVVEENQFYGFFGAVRGWDTVGVGNTGDTGNTGADAIVGAKYTASSIGDATNSGNVFVDNASNHIININAISESVGSEGFSFVSNLLNAFFPSGVDVSHDNSNPKVLLSLYNKTNRQTVTIKVALKAAAVGSGNNTDVISLNLASSPPTYSSFEVLSSTSGDFNGSWTNDNMWETDDEIFVLALSDGVAGINGTPGAPGVTGQGITFGGNIEGELYVQYLDADGISFGDVVPTGIVDGDIGDPGEVGILFGATGFSAGTIYWGNNTDGNTGDVVAGEIFYTNTETEGKLIAISYSGQEVSADQGNAAGYAFGFTAGDLTDGTPYKKKPGSLYFYEQINKSLVLKSFLKYTDARCTGAGAEALVLIKGINDVGPGADAAERLGITLDAGASKNIYTLIVSDGIKGVGITFGVKIDNKLFLDYIDENGNTFGRFESIEGITGPQGSMNPFNIPFTAITGSASINSGQIRVNLNSGVLESVTLSITGGNGDFVGDYLNYPIASGNLNSSGYLSVFSPADVTDFGVFRFRAGASAGDTITFGTNTKPISHVAGNITDIINVTDSTTGFTVGSNLLFAINTDGMRGLSGEIGAGFTYGNEYFISSIQNKPQSRSDNQPLEPGDKWFCIDVALEFTYMGESGGDWSGTPNKGRNDIWLQTNNARQGQQGPRGDKGEGGVVGTVGATGINDFGVYAGGGSYSPRDGVYTTRDYCLSQTTSGSGGDTQRLQINTNWDALNSNEGATNGFFVMKLSATGKQIPGNFPSAGDLWGGNSIWSPVVTNAEGPIGLPGLLGNTGDSVVKFVAVPQGSHEVFLDSVIQDSIGGGPQQIRIRDENNNNVNFRGPTGPAGNVQGSNNQLVYVNGITGQGTTAIVRENTSGTDKVVLVNYRERTLAPTTLTLVNNVLEIDCDIPVQHFTLSGSNDISSVNLVNCNNIGDGATIYIHKPNSTSITWPTSYKLNDTDFEEKYVSSQGFPTPGTIEFDASPCIGGFTFKYLDNNPTILVVNFVSFVTPE